MGAKPIYDALRLRNKIEEILRDQTAEHLDECEVALELYRHKGHTLLKHKFKGTQLPNGLVVCEHCHLPGGKPLPAGHKTQVKWSEEEIAYMSAYRGVLNALTKAKTILEGINVEEK